MQKALLTAAAALSFGIVPLSASAASAASTASDGVFVRVEGARAGYDVDNTRFDSKAARAFGFSAGYRWQVSTPFSLGIEAGYMNLGTVKDQFDRKSLLSSGRLQDIRARSEFGTRAYLLGANGRWNVANKWSLTGRLGVAHARSRVWSRADAGAVTVSYRDVLVHNTAYVGAGVGYAVRSNIDLGLNMTHYSATGSGFAADHRANANVNVFGISAEMRF